LKRLGEKTLKPTLEKVEGVAEAEMAGGVRPEVRIEGDAGYLSAYGFTVESVIAQLQNANINATGGWIEDANQRFIVRAVGEFQNVEEIGDVPAGYKGNTPIRLREVAEIRETGSLENSWCAWEANPGSEFRSIRNPTQIRC
jgi:HAE1 family hydrophobic/amphiphilic exporter-1